MIVRILGDARYEVPEAESGALEGYDAALSAALDGGDEAAFASALGDLVAHVRRYGTIVDPGDVRLSELVVPNEDASLGEVREILASEGDS